METFVVELEDKVTPGAESASASVGGLVSSLSHLASGKGSIESVVSEFSKLAGATGPVAGAIGAVAGTVVELGEKFAGLVLDGAKAALEATELKEKLTATFDALTKTEGGGKATIAMLDGLTGKLGMTREELAPLAEQLLAAGVASKDLPSRLQAIASIKAIGITGGVEEFTKVMLKLQQGVKLSTKDLSALSKTGVNVDEMAHHLGATSLKDLEAKLKSGAITSKQFSDALTDAVNQKGAGALAQQANSLTAQLALAKENVMKLFEDVNTGPFLSGVKSVLGLLDQSTASGKALKLIVTQAFNGIFAVASKVFPYIRAALLGLAIAGLKIYIALKPTIAKFKELFAGGDGKSVDMVGKLAAGVSAIAPIIVMAAEGFLTFAEMAKAGIQKAEAIFAFIGKLQAFVGQIKAVLSGGGTDGGGSLIDGIVAGITGKVGAVYAAIKQMAAGAISTLTSSFKIGSPSKVMAEHGGNIALGMAQGIDKGSGHVDEAMGSLGGGGDMPRGALSPSGAGGGKQITINIEGVNISGAGKELQEVTEEALSLAFERAALMQGAI